ncbi:MAG TPA: hypothetical protein DD735_01860 [Clostridiales bacterium]|jgi:hypothetical protein|nr:hypothetical protein [Clostridiales bacterium]
MSRKKEKAAAREKASTRQFIGITGITDHSLLTSHGELVFFIFKPTNLSVMSDSNIAGRIYALVTVVKGMAELEMLCVNSRENFEENKSFLKYRLEVEDNPAIRKLVQQDTSHLDRMQVLMATAREFCFVIRLDENKESNDSGYLSRIEKAIRDQSFTVHRADSGEIKKMLGVYYEQNVTTEKYENFDGERWIILDD